MKPLTLNTALCLLFFCTLGPVVLIPFGEYLALEPWGNSLGHLFMMICMGSIIVPLGCMVWAVVEFIKKRQFARPALVFACSALFIASTTLGIKLAFSYRREAFQQLAARSRPLVDALRAYEAKKGRAPSDLAALVPDFLPEIPLTGMGAYPEYKYVKVEDRSNWDGNPWVLYIETPPGGPAFDMFLYFPLQNYPKTGYGGSLERIGDWAYVHE